MEKIEYRASIARDRSMIRLETLVDGIVKASADVEAPELDDFIALLMGLRAELRDEVRRELDPGSRVPGVFDPIWRTPKKHPDGNRVLLVRHPGAGWISYMFPDYEAKAIANEFAA